jgi:hypothetical protein
MPRSRRWADDEGSASLEFVTAGMILLVPLVYLVLVMSSIQAGALAAEGAARQAVRVFVQAPDVGSARAGAMRAVEFALSDHGLDPAAASVSVTCRPKPSSCLTRQGFVTVTVDMSVALPFAPAALQGDFAAAVPLHATATQQVSRFWGSG